jgi:hypothetical protein
LGGASPAAPSQIRSSEVARASDDHHDPPAVNAKADKADQQSQPPEKKKKGFWSRVFGRK